MHRVGRARLSSPELSPRLDSALGSRLSALLCFLPPKRTGAPKKPKLRRSARISRPYIERIAVFSCLTAHLLPVSEFVK